MQYDQIIDCPKSGGDLCYKVEVNNKVNILSENQSTYLPLGCIHRLSNPGKIPLKLIEVQSGTYLGEDDIERLEDNYGRINL